MKFKLFFASVFLSLLGYAQTDINIGKTYSLHSDILDEERILEIYTPEGYESSDKTYPVLYLLDSYYKFEHAVGTVEFLHLNRLIPEMIIIGIRNTRRNRDLTPVGHDLSEHDQSRMPGRGGADNFLAFMEEELMPYVEKNYRAAPYKVIVGHSLGGLLGTYSFFKQPDLFEAYLTISPSLWYNNQLINKELDEVLAAHPDLSAVFYLTLANERKGSMPGNVHLLTGKFTNYINENKDADLRFKYDPMYDETHGSIGLPGLYNGLRYIFEPTQYEVPKTKELIMASGGPEKVIEDVLNYYSMLSEKYGFTVSNESALTSVGFALLKFDEFQDEAVKAFRISTEHHPESHNAYSVLGTAYERTGDIEKARSNYEKALRMIKATGDPEWEFYQTELDNLKSEE